jgi:hypothetical protein
MENLCITYEISEHNFLQILLWWYLFSNTGEISVDDDKGFGNLFFCEPGSSASIVSGYGLENRAIEIRSPAEANGYFL